MRASANLRRLILGASVMSVACALLVAWQLAAYFQGNIPGHILPLVRLLCGTQEAMPVAFDWTVRLAFLSVGALGCSLIALGFALRCLHQANRTKAPAGVPQR